MLPKELIIEWDFDFNNLLGLDPFSVSSSSGRKVGWVCKEGHHWEAKISNRSVLGQGCPYCSGNKAIKGVNDFATQYPELLSEWDYAKNSELGIFPDNILSGSGKNAWWKCSLAHSYQTKIYEKVKGNGCPYCSNHRVLSGYNDLLTIAPNLAKEWDSTKNANEGLFPDKVLSGSHKKAWWICQNGHSWRAVIYNRVAGIGCPYCAGSKVISGKTDLSTKHPELLAEWDYEKNNASNIFPESISPFSKVKVWWKCSKGHPWQATPNARAGKYKQGCPVCSNHQVIVGVNDLATTNPEIAKEWNYEKNTILGFNPNNIVIGSNRTVWWKCRKGHEWKSIVANRLKTGCPVCSKEMRTSFPEQAVYFYMNSFFSDCINGDKTIISPLELDVYIPSLNTAIEYDGRTWHSGKDAAIRDNHKNTVCAERGIRLFRIREIGCEKTDPIIGVKEYWYKYGDLEALEKIISNIAKDICGLSCNVNIKQDRNSILSLFVSRDKERSIVSVKPELLNEWDYDKNQISPESISAGSQIKVWWKCSLGHSWEANVSNRVKGRNCPYCTNRIILIGFNDLATTNHNLLAEWDYEKNNELGIDPNNVTRGSSKKVWWKCSRGHSWNAVISSRTNSKAGVGCPYCCKSGNGKLLERYNDLGTTNPDIAAEWNYEKNGELLPSMVRKGQHKKVWWRCTKGHEWESYIFNRVRGRSCPICNKEKKKHDF